MKLLIAFLLFAYLSWIWWYGRRARRGIPPLSEHCRNDVLRIIHRDYLLDSPDDILAILDEYGAEPWHRERDRVHLAILKLSNGKSDLIRNHIENARIDFRNVIIPAEYPNSGLSKADTRQLRQRDKEQYENWLHQSFE